MELQNLWLGACSLPPTEYFEKKGDITWLKPEFREKFDHSRRSKRLTKTDIELWEDGIIPYSFSSSYSCKELAIFNRTMHEGEKKLHLLGQRCSTHTGWCPSNRLLNIHLYSVLNKYLCCSTWYWHHVDGHVSLWRKDMLAFPWADHWNRLHWVLSWRRVSAVWSY